MITRKATAADIPAMARLTTELGYPTTPDELTIRFQHLSSQPDYHTVVAENDSGEVVGLIGLHKFLSWEFTGYRVRIIALVVLSSARQQGIGEALIEAAEAWAYELGAGGLMLNCGNRPERAAAHRFYQRMGFVARSTGYWKKLSTTPDQPVFS